MSEKTRLNQQRWQARKDAPSEQYAKPVKAFLEQADGARKSAHEGMHKAKRVRRHLAEMGKVTLDWKKPE